MKHPHLNIQSPITAVSKNLQERSCNTYAKSPSDDVNPRLYPPPPSFLYKRIITGSLILPYTAIVGSSSHPLQQEDDFVDLPGVCRHVHCLYHILKQTKTSHTTTSRNLSKIQIEYAVQFCHNKFSVIQCENLQIKIPQFFHLSSKLSLNIYFKI